METIQHRGGLLIQPAKRFSRGSTSHNGSAKFGTVHIGPVQVNFAASTLRVSHKPDRGWAPKADKEREIPIPAKLTKRLKAWKAKADKACDLVFPTAV